jgi:hypothetical protein
MLDMLRIPGSDTEKKLSALCFHVLQAHHDQRPLGMNLPGAIIPTGTGLAHRNHCLQALALYGIR